MTTIEQAASPSLDDDDEWEASPKVRVGDPVYDGIVEFLIEEARLLDHDRLDDWVELMADDLVYVAPVRVTKARGEGRGFVGGMAHFEEDLDSIKLRVHRLERTSSRWAEDPPSRCRRLITNVLVRATERDGEYLVASYILLTRNRLESPSVDVVSAERRDLLRRDGAGWKLARRTILLDQAVLGTPNLAVFL